jgi:hypothetical protein
MPRPAEKKKKKRGERQVLCGKDEIKAAIVQATANASRTIAILTPDLEPEIYDQEEFLEALKRFILSRGFARVKVLITNPARTVKNGNNFVSMGRRLNSYIEFRHLKPELGMREDAFFIADEAAIVYRSRSDSWDAVADPHEPAIARHYLSSFDQIWHACATEPELRHSQL